MRTVGQSEAIATLPKLLDEVEQQSVVISREGQEIAALVSIEDFARVRKLNLDRIDEISRKAEARIERHAAELGIAPEQLVERLLRDDE
jgi:prevent-host-death family protein